MERQKGTSSRTDGSCTKPSTQLTVGVSSVPAQMSNQRQPAGSGQTSGPQGSCRAAACDIYIVHSFVIC